MSIASLTPRVREALGVSSSYDAATIPAAIKRAASRLLRDYNFPKATMQLVVPIAGPGQSINGLPTGLGKVLGIKFNNPADNTYSDWLIRREGHTLPVADGATWYWWQRGDSIRFSNPYDSMVGWNILLWYRSINPDDNGGWIYDDFEDVLYYATVYREAATMRKPEVQQAFAALYQEELSALAIYLNELEWSGVVVNQREERIDWRERYPAS